ncbi:hypothetical protein P280DRAFT_485098 [Massarina eburnea CBS 473.64]|uniref:Uncharacterized protein n=1 Tax=Massarina eburnea CBS 473.64 TaxID=1395130 RepID=A0A6A6RHT0_9PLEO|nr:hypothetical protein P280DRAFT_485098 [Massarina eburnea CBS 473.64]
MSPPTSPPQILRWPKATQQQEYETLAPWDRVMRDMDPKSKPKLQKTGTTSVISRDWSVNHPGGPTQHDERMVDLGSSNNDVSEALLRFSPLSNSSPGDGERRDIPKAGTISDSVLEISVTDLVPALPISIKRVNRAGGLTQVARKAAAKGKRPRVLANNVPNAPIPRSSTEPKIKVSTGQPIPTKLTPIKPDSLTMQPRSTPAEIKASFGASAGSSPRSITKSYTSPGQRNNGKGPACGPKGKTLATGAKNKKKKQ